MESFPSHCGYVRGPGQGRTCCTTARISGKWPVNIATTMRDGLLTGVSVTKKNFRNRLHEETSVAEIQYVDQFLQDNTVQPDLSLTGISRIDSCGTGVLYHKRVMHSCIHVRPRCDVQGDESGLWSAFNHSWSYPRLQFGSGGVCRCMRGDLMWTCLVWAERSMPGKFLVPSQRFNSATGEQKGITQTQSPSRAVGCLTH